MNLAKFNAELDASGYAKTVIAERSGVPYRRLLAICYGEVRCTVEDAASISDFLKWDRKTKHDIFLL